MALGKNLNNILEDYFGNDEQVGGGLDSEIRKINIDEIAIGPYQTRKDFDEDSLKALSNSIKNNGLIAPILVHQDEDGSFVLLAGERRLRASKMAELTTIEAKIISNNQISEEKKIFLTAYENLLREDLNPIELSKTYKMLIEKNSLALEDLAINIGKSPQYVRNYLKLVELNPEVQKLLESKKLSEGQARHLYSLTEDEQLTKAQEIIDNNMTVRLLEKAKDKTKKTSNSEDDSFILDHPMFTELKNFKNRFPNSNVKFNGNMKKGKIVINFDTRV